MTTKRGAVLSSWGPLSGRKPYKLLLCMYLSALSDSKPPRILFRLSTSLTNRIYSGGLNPSRELAVPRSLSVELVLNAVDSNCQPVSRLYIFAPQRGRLVGCTHGPCVCPRLLRSTMLRLGLKPPTACHLPFLVVSGVVLPSLMTILLIQPSYQSRLRQKYPGVT